MQLSTGNWLFDGLVERHTRKVRPNAVRAATRTTAEASNGLKSRRISPSPSAAPFRHENTTSPSTLIGGIEACRPGEREESVAVVERLAEQLDVVELVSAEQQRVLELVATETLAPGRWRRWTRMPGPGRERATGLGDHADAAQKCQAEIDPAGSGASLVLGKALGEDRDRADRDGAERVAGRIGRLDPFRPGTRGLERPPHDSELTLRADGLAAAPTGKTTRSRWSRAGLSIVVRNSTRRLP